MSVGIKLLQYRIRSALRPQGREPCELVIHGGLPILAVDDPASSSTARPSTETRVRHKGVDYLIRSSLSLPQGRDEAEVDAAAKSLGLDLAGLNLEQKRAMACFGQAPNVHNLSFCEIALGLSPWPSPSDLNSQRLERVAKRVAAVAKAHEGVA
jgi:hypothetical protein